MDQAVRCPDPFVQSRGKWLVRQLSPDSSPIDIETLQGWADQDRLLHAMAWETANVQVGTAGAAKRIIPDLKSRPGRWLRFATRNMVKTVLKDWKEWKTAH